jgi:hypothetical protein
MDPESGLEPAAEEIRMRRLGQTHHIRTIDMQRIGQCETVFMDILRRGQRMTSTVRSLDNDLHLDWGRK